MKDIDKIFEDWNEEEEEEFIIKGIFDLVIGDHIKFNYQRIKPRGKISKIVEMGIDIRWRLIYIKQENNGSIRGFNSFKMENLIVNG